MLENYKWKNKLLKKCAVVKLFKNQNHNKKCVVIKFSKDQNYNKKGVVVEFSKNQNYNKKCIIVISLKDQKNLLYIKFFKLKIFKKSLLNKKSFIKFVVDKYLNVVDRWKIIIIIIKIIFVFIVHIFIRYFNWNFNLFFNFKIFVELNECNYY